MNTILIVDDDEHIRHLVSSYLKQEHYLVYTAKNGEEALQILKKESCDLAIIDIMMPKMNGYELTKKIREVDEMPIILLTAKGQIEDKEKGFNAGTDDYLVKPFEPKELLFRMRALLKRSDKSYDEVIALGSTTINKKSYEVTIGSDSYLLPLKEFELLYLLAANKDRVFSRDELVERIWGFDYEGDYRTVDVHIKRLRERFSQVTDDFHLKTVRGVGYALGVKG